MSDLTHALTAEAKAAMVANLQLEIAARQEKLRAQCEAQCASLRSRLERRVNRIPPTKRQMLLVDLLDASLPAAKPTLAKTAPANKAPAPAPATRKTRTVPPATSSRSAAPKEEPKPAVAKTAPKPTITKEMKSTRGKKRGSDEVSSEDKENAAELAVPKKRVRTATTKAPAAAKPAATTRTTRAASRTKTAPTQVLSPKNNNANARSKPAAARSTRPR
ncbi:uncharacterized protein K460DRAFT_360304 [Cucurbitaria berberidis CBS 394.84]|uniref:Borealin N-terminal domain-containing protein n=1 Tax=Cucurbitaria berberidis CBS 394.84 TaxID=1168544 RepID=A0A9P4G6P3_9PLEO|nr:uncharacterized protein K460DRAFT_360304 [Cucurbitaria berberidis CBS 394.84]KAF1839921.1 hypothetical protein K460DRAFT_360304 [Cucurbitaria berberidis CBS 394.84]